MNNGNVLWGAALGAFAVYMLDPRTGARRRALVRDKLVRAANVTRDAMDTTARDVANRTRGIAAATRARWQDEDVSDVVLLERVRAKLGRWSSHARAIDVDVCDGEVTLCGPALTHEAPSLISAVDSVRGVKCVINALELHDTPVNIPALQGEGNVAGASLDIMQRNWAPATRALVATVGLAATGLCLAAYNRRRVAA